MDHIMASLHLLKERIFFFMCILNLVFFKTWFVSFFSPPPKFSQNCFSQHLFCVSYFYRGRKVVFCLCCSCQGELLLFIGEVVSISYRVELFGVPLILYFLLSLLCMFTLYRVVFVNMRQKGGDLDEMWEFCLFCLGGDTLIVYDTGKYKYVLLYLTQGESQFAYLLFSCFPVFIFHTCVYAFCLVFQ